MNENLKLSAPWVTFYREICALFEKDKCITIKFDLDTPEIKLFVANPVKADALMKLLPDKRVYGNVELKITVIPADSKNDEDIVEVFDNAFYGNPVVKDIYGIETMLGKFNYCVFEKKVVQFYNDQMDDINGNKSTLYQEIAKDVFGDKHAMFYCTDTDDEELTKPLGEWP